MKSVGLMTCYMDNYGACLQAYALQQSIIKAGHKCEIIKYTPIRNLKDYGPVMTIGRTVYRSFKGIINVNFRFDNYRHQYFERFRKEYLTFSKMNYLNDFDLYNHTPIYDCYVTGSDQIWNPNLYGGKNNLAYFLDFVPEGKKKIAYAPSIGVSSISDACAQEMAALLSKFDAISVREEDGKQIIDRISNCGCRVVLDPTLLISKEEWNVLIGKRIIKKQYILLYLFGNRSYIKEFVEYVSKKTGMMVVTLPFNEREYRSDYIKIKRAGPIEFINLIKYASLVITDSFHATAFSINLHAPFYSLLRNESGDKNNMNSRIFNMLNLADLKDRLISDYNGFPKDITYELDFEKSDKNIKERREKDFDFLKNALER